MDLQGEDEQAALEAWKGGAAIALESSSRRLEKTPGPGVAQEALFARVDSLFPAPGAALSREALARPVRILVPSRKLRLHLSEGLVRHRGRPVAGVLVQTLHGAALEILERGGESPPLNPHLFDVIVERFARAEPPLAAPLEALVDGYLPVSETVRDLLDAGFEPALLEAAEDLFEAEGADRASRLEVERGRALLRVAAAADRALEIIGAGGSGRLLQRAEQWLEDDPDGVLPARAVLIYGFADATGRAMDLLETLVRRRGACLFVDQPPDPVREGAFESEFPRVLLERFGISGAGEAAGPLLEPAPPAKVERVEATDPETEVLAVADRIRALLDEGRRPESMAVVARDPGPYELAVWDRFTRWGIPYSAPSARGSFTAAGRRAAALLGLLSRGGETATDVWLEALNLSRQDDGETPSGGAGLRMELRIAFHAVGAGRLRQATELDPDPWIRDGAFPLPVLEGLDREADGGGGVEAEDSAPPAGVNRRSLAAAALRRAIRDGRGALRKLEAWPSEQSLEGHYRTLGSLLRESLGWSPAGVSGELWRALGDLREQSPGALTLTFREFLRLLRSGLEEVGFKALGGSGPGVQFLSVTEARGLTFQHLFLLGLARDSFPRPIREDPLLPDSLRLLLRGLLPEIPVKGRGFEEERYLFAQLLASSPRVVLSRPLASGDGRPVAPSPLWERLRWGPRELPAVQRVTSLYSGADPGGRLRDPVTHSVLAGLFGGREGFRRRFKLVLDARGGDPRGRLAAARLRVLDEMDPDLRTPEGRRRSVGLGPYLGLVGPPRDRDPRHRALSLTTLEGMAACSWQTFLRRLLRLEPNPDPLQALPELSPLLVGRLVHEVLESLVAERAPEGAGGDLAGALAASPWEVPWPSPQGLESLLMGKAEALLRDHGIAFLQLARPLARRARPYLEVARQSLWGREDLLRAGGSEVEGCLRLVRGSRIHPVSFRADLVCETAGERRVLDLKTGRPLSRNKTSKGRRTDLLRAVARGERLQAVAYLVAAEEILGEGAAAAARGSYLFLDPGTEGDQREVSVSAADGDLKDAFRLSSEAALAAWWEGAFPPRLVEPKTDKEPRRCRFCPVAEACLRGDSGARRRLLRLSESLPKAAAEDDRRSALEGAYRDIWDLGRGP